MEDFTGLLELWIDNVDDPALLAELEQLKTGDETAVRDAFYQDLTFGTAGLRGIIGAAEPHERLHRREGHAGPRRLH